MAPSAVSKLWPHMDSSFFLVHVIHVVGMGAKPKMCGIYAIPNITGMTNEHTFWNFSNMYFIGIPMSGKRLTIDANAPIPTRSNSANPQPARICLVYLLRKTLFVRHRLWHVTTLPDKPQLRNRPYQSLR